MCHLITQDNHRIKEGYHLKDDKMKMTRRKFLQVSAAAGAVAAAGGLELAAQAAKESGQEESDLTYPAADSQLTSASLSPQMTGLPIDKGK